MKTTLVFVYGSLRKGFYNHSLLINSEFISNHTTEPEFTLVDLGAFPAALDKGSTAIYGELYRINELIFKKLDKLEGYPDYYDRVLIQTEFGKAWMYILAKEGRDYPIIETGVWNPE